MKKIRIITAALFFIIAVTVPSISTKAASCGETVSQNTTAELQAIDYENNETIGKLLASSWYSETETMNKMSFEDSFAQVQADIGNIIQKVIDSTKSSDIAGPEYYTDTIQRNKEKLLLGLAYLYRLYDFDMGEHNIKDVLLYETKASWSAADIYDVLDWLIYIGGSGGDTLKISNNASVFGSGKLFSPVTSCSSLDAFLEEYRQKFIPNVSMNEWFLQESSAYIVENISVWSTESSGLYKRLCGDTSLRAHVLPLLTISEDSFYVIANSTTITYGLLDSYIDRNLRQTDPTQYKKLCEKFRLQLEQAAKQQNAFIDFWYRIALPEKKGQLSSNRIVLDTLRIDSGTTIQWSDKFGANAALGVREFFAPLNLYATYMFVDGMADGTGFRYYVSKALTERGLSTYAHELTHLLISDTMLGGYGSRDGMLAEVYTRGMFEPYELNDPPAFNLNLIYDRPTVSDRYHNGQPELFQSETDLQDYMSGILDVVYTLDYAEADIILSKSAEEKKKWFHKLEQIEDTENRTNQGESGSRHNLDSVREVTLEEAKALNTIDDLIRNSIIVSRYEVIGTTTTGTMARNGYYVVPLFSSNYAGVQNNYGVSGDIMIRRQAFELLAEYGYYGGMVPYISNQYKAAAKSDGTILSDQYILKKIFGGTYETMADFKKAMFQKRIEKTSNLKPVTITWKNQSVTINTFEELRGLMKEAVESDLINVRVMPGGANNIRAQETEVERLKQEIFKAYLFLTDDFRESIYGTAQTPVQPPDPGTTPGGDTDPVTPEKPEDTNPKPSVNPGSGSNNSSTGTNTPNAGAAAPGTGTSNTVSKTELLLCKISSAKTSHTIRWNSIGSADGYEIYGASSSGKYKRLQTVSKGSNKWTHKKLKKGKQYKYYVEAYKEINGKRVILARSLSLYSTTKGGKYGNPSKIKPKKTSVRVKSGKKVKLSVKVTGKKIRKSEKKVRYLSSDPSVAIVSAKGAVTGKKRGSCTVYCIARNGLYKKVKVTVK